MWKRVDLPAFVEETLFIDTLIQQLSGLSESERWVLASQQFDVWLQRGYALELFPAIPERQDWWYLCQVLALRWHTIDNGNNYHFQYKQKTIYLPNPLPSLAGPTSLTELYEWIDKAQSQISAPVDACGEQYQLRPLTYDEVLRVDYLFPEYGLSTLDGWFPMTGIKSHSPALTTHFIGGNEYFGGARYVDTFLPNIPLTKLVPLLIWGPRL